MWPPRQSAVKLPCLWRAATASRGSGLGSRRADLAARSGSGDRRARALARGGPTAPRRGVGWPGFAHRSVNHLQVRGGRPGGPPLVRARAGSPRSRPGRSRHAAAVSTSPDGASGALDRSPCSHGGSLANVSLVASRLPGPVPPLRRDPGGGNGVGLRRGRRGDHQVSAAPPVSTGTRPMPRCTFDVRPPSGTWFVPFADTVMTGKPGTQWQWWPHEPSRVRAWLGTLAERSEPGL